MSKAKTKRAPYKPRATGSKKKEAEQERPPSQSSSKASSGDAGTAPTEPPPTYTSVEPCPRDAVHEAAMAEARLRGIDARDAASLAEALCDRLRLVGHEGDHSTETALLDLRSKQDYVYPHGANKVRTIDRNGRVPLMRDPSTVDTIVVHQTSTEFGVSKRAVDLIGDIEVARAHRALDVACHMMAFRNGYYVAAHDPRVYVNHANRLNATSLGLEIEGRYPGLVDDPDTLPREDLKTTWGLEGNEQPTELTELTVKAACASLEWLVSEGHAYGMGIKYVMAHRQSSNLRRSDPGEEIWQRVVLDYAVGVLGLETKPETKWSQGYHIPRIWDPDGIGEY